MKIIFLDIDGVLNTHERFENGYCGIRPENVIQLNRLLTAVPDAKIVLTSSWRYMVPTSMNLDGFTNLLLSHGINCLPPYKLGQRLLSKLIGLTAKDEEIAGRGAQIKAWRIANNFQSSDKHVVLDDMLWDFANYPWLNIVLTDAAKGLQPEQVEKAIKFLS